jgi:cellulose synthase operon protein YhjQ
MPLLCLASPKGGVGKTTLAANLAHALLRCGRRVVALDLDPQNALRLHLGLPLDDPAAFAADLPRRPDWRRALVETPAGVPLLAHGPADLRAALGLARALDQEPDLLARPLRAMRADPELLVVADTAPGASAALAIAATEADLVLAVLLADAASAALLPEVEGGAFLARGTLGALRAGRVAIVLNQVDRASRSSLTAAETIAGLAGPRLVGAICRDEAVAEALSQQRPLLDLAPESPAAADLLDLAAAVDGMLRAGAPAPGAAAW